jgi:hypothetical protein
MIPTIEQIVNPRGAGFPILGSGCYAEVYDLGDGTVLKKASGIDGTCSYIEWCFNRRKELWADVRIGRGIKHSRPIDDALIDDEMVGMPSIHAFGKWLVNGEFLGSWWWCVMPKYKECLRDAEVRESGTRVRVITGLKPLTTLLNKEFGDDFCNDVHGGNVMFDDRRKQWVLIDPSTSRIDGLPKSAGSYKAQLSSMSCSEPKPVQSLAAGLFDVMIKAMDNPRIVEELEIQEFKARPKEQNIAEWKIPQLRKQIYMR